MQEAVRLVSTLFHITQTLQIRRTAYVLSHRFSFGS